MPKRKVFSADYIDSRIKQLGNRANWESHWEECYTYVIPRMANSLALSSASTMSNAGKSIASNWNSTGGKKKGPKVYDSTAIRANEDLASALHGMLTNPATLWFELNSGIPEIDELKHVKHWLQQSAEKMHTVFNNSNFQSQIHELYLGLGCIGTAAIYAEEDPVDLIRFQTAYMAMTHIAEDYRGVVDTVYKKVPRTWKQVVEKFGDELHPDIMEKYENKPYEQTLVWHIVEPRYTDGKEPKNMPIASVWYHPDTRSILRESGYQEMPWSVPRWTVVSGEEYGRSPTMKSLADIKSLNALSKNILMHTEKQVNPALLVNTDGQMLPPRTFPGGINYIESQAIGSLDPIRPLEIGGDIRVVWRTSSTCRTPYSALSSTIS